MLYHNRNFYYENVIYDSENVIKCERCNNVIFYIENEMYHVCPYKENEKVKIDESVIRNKSNKLLCKIDKIENVCVNHEKELSCLGKYLLLPY